MNPPHAPGVEAASWAVAAHLAARLDDRFRLAEGHPGQQDILCFYDSDQPQPKRDEVMLLVYGVGSIRVRRANGRDVDGIGGDNVWGDLSSGRVGVSKIVQKIVDALGDAASLQPSSPRASDLVYATLAAVLARAALFGLQWRCLWGVDDNSGSYSGKDERAYLFQPYLPDLIDVGIRDDETYGQPERYWFLLDEQDQPLAAFDIDGYLHLPAPGGGVKERIALAEDSHALPAQVADDVFTRMIRAALRKKAHAGIPARSELGLPAILSAFNRKERLFLLGYASGGLDNLELHSPGLRLSDAFRTNLEAAIDLPVPAHAWAGVDYHLSWLHAAVQWHRGITWPGQLSDFPPINDPAGEGLITGTQQDADLIVAWADQEQTRVVLIEAKGYGSWDNAQATAKLARIGAIKDAAGSDIDIRFVLTSPRRPEKLNWSGWPTWALTTADRPFWLSMPTPRLRVKTERCDPHGHTSSEGEHWKITRPST